MPSWALGKPVADQLGFVCAVVAHDDVNIEFDGDTFFDLVEEFAKLLGTMPTHTLAYDGSSLHTECGEK